METATIYSPSLPYVPDFMNTLSPLPFAEPETIVQKLDRLSSLRATVALTEKSRKDFVDARLAAFREELLDFDADLLIAREAVEELEAEVRDSVIECGVSVKASFLHAVFSAPRTTWDGKALEAYAVACPAILAFRKVGQPSVSIREIKGGM